MNASPRSAQSPPSDRGHPEPGGVAVERNRERQRPRIRRIDVAELERHEREEQAGRRIDAEPLGIRDDWSPRPPQRAPDPGGRARDREPWVERRPDVSEQHLQRDDPEPEDDVDERRREIRRGRGLAEEGGQEDENEQPGRERSEDDVESGRAERPLEPRSKRPPTRPDARAAGASRACRGGETRARARRQRPTRRATSEPAGRGRRRSRGRRSRANLEIGDLQPAVFQLHLEPAGRVGFELDAGGAPGCDVGHQVVAVQVDVV